MPALALNQPIEQRGATLLVSNRLEPGAHRFALVVLNDRGVGSEPDLFTVTVRRALVVDPVRPPIDPRIDPPVRPPVSGPAPGPVVSPIVNPVLTPVVTPVVRPRGGVPRKGKKHGPE